MADRPLVSIVIATYNRSNVLRYAIGSVVDQTLQRWELIVVGDACTDDTADVVASFGDERIRFVNLPRNVGEQSGPNNAGLRLARGRYLALLNHDDLWLPDHLEAAVGAIERTGADLVFALVSYRSRRLEGGEPMHQLEGASPTGRYEPYVFATASSWVFRRELLARVGPWRPARECVSAPSRDWLLRARRRGADLRSLPVLTVVGLAASLYGPGAYARRDWTIHAEIAERVRSDPHFRERELTGLAVQAATEVRSPKRLDRALYAALKSVLWSLLAPLGGPGTVLARLRYRRKGSFIDVLRRYRGLPPLPKIPARVE